MGNCKDCKHWEPREIPFVDTIDNEIWGECTGHKPSPLIWIASDDYAEMLTKPDYGCVLFEDKHV